MDQTYIHNNYKGYIGSRAFVRDDDAQKAFSKLRSSQAGMYFWRCFPHSPQNPGGCPPEFMQKSAAAQAALIRETDFAFKQAFAFCPYSPEAVFRYVNFLMQIGRFDDAVTVVETDKKLDPYNEQLNGTIQQIKGIRDANAGRTKAIGEIDKMEKMARTNPANIGNLIYLGGTYMQLQQTNRAFELFNQAIANPAISYQDAAAVAQYFGQMGNLPGFENALRKIIVLAPDLPEHRYNLAAIEAISGRTPEALADLKLALDLNTKRLATNPAAVNILTFIRNDPNIAPLRNLPEFQKLVPPQ